MKKTLPTLAGTLAHQESVMTVSLGLAIESNGPPPDHALQMVPYTSAWYEVPARIARSNFSKLMRTLI